jgi:nucleoside-diphosphate-sugar epimerase
MPNYLVTGGAGFIGSHIVEALIKLNSYSKATVRVLDNCATGKMANLDGCMSSIEFIKGDIRDLSVVREAVENIDYVLHQAALPSVPRSIKDPIATHEVNATGTLNVLVAARDANVKRVVYASSSSIYGDTPILPKREDIPANPISPYAIAKYTGEQYCKAFFQLYGLETIALRYFNVFGPRQDPNSQYAAVIPKFISAYLNGEQPIIYGNGEQSRDFTYVENVVQANLLACHAKNAAGQVFNIACGRRTTINDLAKGIKSLLESPIEFIYGPPREGEVRHSLADIQKAREFLGYEPKVFLEEGLQKMI